MACLLCTDVCLFIYILFKDANSSDYTVSNDRMISE
jgi:hypothetical protein